MFFSMADAKVSYTKSYIKFLSKIAFITLFVLVLPLLPPIAPVNATSWELLQLIFVGIAVSYGLFSRRNDEEPKLDDAQSYLTHKLHQVSSVFDDESESQAVIESKVETLMNSKYCRGEPVVVVAKQGIINDGCGIRQKPLLLPVRSLKQRAVADEPSVEVQKSGVNFLEEDMVLCSPIPWRLRSQRMEEHDFDLIDDESMPTFSSESQAKSSEDDLSRKKNYFSSSPPPAPPPLAHQYVWKSVISKSNSAKSKASRPSVSLLELSETEIEEEEEEEEEVHLRRGRIRHDGLVKSERKSVDYKATNLFVDDKKATNGEFEDEFLPKGETLVEKVMMETSYGDSDDNYIRGCLVDGEAISDTNNNIIKHNSDSDVGPDVDKKADEFIAKFREQIRQQRIESIRRSTAQRAGKNSR